MINGTLEQFLDTGWYSECTLYFEGYLYWCEQTKNEDNNKLIFFVDKWKAQNENNLYYSTLVDENKEPVDYQRVLEIEGEDIEELKHQFLSSPIFNQKSFWEVESKIAWLDYSGKDTLYNSIDLS